MWHQNSSSLWQRAWNRIFRAKDFYSSIRVLIALAFILGITPYHVTQIGYHGERVVRESWYGFANAISRWLIFAYCYTHVNLHNESLIGYFMRNHISLMGTRIHDIGGIIAAIFIFIAPLFLRRHLRRSFEGLVRVDRRLLRINYNVDYPRIQFESLRMLVIITALDATIISVCLTCFAQMEVRASWQLIFIMTYELITISVTVFMFCLLALSVRRRLSRLHRVLKNLAHQWDTRSLKAVQKQRSLQCLDSFSMYTIVTKDPAEIIQESMEIHHLICEAAATANKYFTYQLLTIISIAFLIIVFDAYYVLETLLGKSKRESKFKTVEFVTFFSCQMILYLIAIISIVEGSNRAIKKSEKTGGIVHSLLNKTKSVEVREKLQQFSMQLMHLKINFTAAGLFNIDRTLYFTISGALTTYLIILLQFTSNSPNNDNGNGYECCEALHNMTNHTL
ncbi:putative gustatory receptor 28b isoform X4 [Drosophila sulfurigaster albostrigata]|uniref:putative gustatory receptor 28b isoform X4 n=1 Tax=Drosophila sulfurigaster albostrigata TaxID=89887 RepID=UPI002D21E3D3|nr:putative gustatory receptor 28b isoform X4 [Drosophila sulfurigaster albostrigata]